MSQWEGPTRWINTILLVIVGFIGFDTLFELLGANVDNVLVGFTNAVSGVFLAPFQGMFAEQDYLLTALIAVLGYSLLAGVALAVTRSVQASRRQAASSRPPTASAPRQQREQSRGTPAGAPRQRAEQRDERTRRL